jgi:hypothetical protein
MTSPTTLAFRQRISDILMSDSCQRIDFRWGPYHIDGWNYTAVGLALIGANHSLHVSVGHMSAHAEATYDPDTNTIRLPHANYAAATIGTAANPNLAFQRMTIVHECTHAAVDQLRRARHILYRSNEVLAYVGGALFNAYEGNPFTPAPTGVYAAARVVAANIKDSPGAIIGAPADVQALETAITQDAAYSFLKTRPHTMTTNSGLRL